MRVERKLVEIAPHVRLGWLTEAAARYWDLAVVLALSLVPLLWFRGMSRDMILTGSDMDYPLDAPGRFIERLFVWNDAFLGGSDRSTEVATLFWTGLQAVGQIVTGSLRGGEELTFVLWFGGNLVAAWIFLRHFFPRTAQTVRLAGVVFYGFNFYQIYNWEIARIGELSAMFALPLLMVLLDRVLSARGFLWLNLLALAGVSFAFSGAGVHPPTVVVVALLLGAFAFYRMLVLREVSWAAVRAFGLYAAVFALTSAYWLVMLVEYVWAGGLATAGAPEDFAVADLLRWTSQDTSILNNLRMLGRVVHFDGWSGYPYYPALAGYRDNTLLALLAFTWPALAVLGLLSRNRLIPFFGLVAVAILLLMTGLHAPLGAQYNWLIEHVPGFWIFRAPFEHWGLLLPLAYTFLIVAGIDELGRRLQDAQPWFMNRQSELRAALLPLAVVVLVLAYHHPLVTGDLLPRQGDRGTLPGHDMAVPAYVTETGEWLGQQPGPFNVLVLPNRRANVYEWGYGAPKDITIEALRPHGILFEQYGEGTLHSRPVDEAYSRAARMLYESSPDAGRYLAKHNVRYVLNRKDFIHDFYGPADDSAEAISAALSGTPSLELVATFGRWELWENLEFEPRIRKAGNLFVGGGGALAAEAAAFRASALAPGSAGALATRIVARSAAAPESGVAPRGTPVVFDFSPLRLQAFVREGWTLLVTNATEVDPGVLRLARAEACPLSFISGGGDWFFGDATVVYISPTADGRALRSVSVNGAPSNAITGVWWPTGCAGGTSPLLFPVQIPPGQPAVLQINSMVSGTVSIDTDRGPVSVDVQEWSDGGFSERRWLSVVDGSIFDVPQWTKRDVPTAVVWRLDGPCVEAAVRFGSSDAESVACHEIGDAAWVLASARLAPGEGIVSAPGLGDPSIGIVADDPGEVLAALYEDHDDGFRIVDFQRVSAVRYEVTIDSDDPGLLIFAAPFDARWNLSLGSRHGLATLLPAREDGTHVMVDGFANGWWIEETGTYTVTLFFEPQRRFAYGSIVSLGTLALLAGVVVWQTARRRSKP